jgi:hypothetical protein|tara:strand:- start:395 stop:655 length:261 start_codon:yes stop_codon:yes gene_type:complete
VAKGINMSDIEAQLNELIAKLSPEQIKKVLTEVKTNVRTSVDTSRRQNSIRKTELYFANAPRPKDNFEDYLNHSDGIREQVISGVL